MILLIASLSVMLAYAAVSSIPGLQASRKPVDVDTISQYTTEIAPPDPSVFNDNAINPTVDVTIGKSNE